MNSISTKLLALISALVVYGALLFLLFAALPLSSRAQTNAVETGTSSGVATTDKALVATNETNSSAESTPVRIDGTGVHIGGENPVDIGMPGISKSSLPAVLALLVPFASFVMIVAIVAIIFYFIHRRNKLVHETLRAMIEKGVPIPSDFLAKSENSAKRPRNDFRSGLLLTGLGIGIVLIIGKTGWIAVFIGVAFFIAAFVEKRNKNDEQSPKP